MSRSHFRHKATRVAPFGYSAQGKFVHRTVSLDLYWNAGEPVAARATWLCGATSTRPRLTNEPGDGSPCEKCEKATTSTRRRPRRPPLSLVPAPTQTIVYRLFDRDRNLLYVGVTGDLRNRLTSHRCTKPWFDEVAHVETLVFPTESAAARSETELIARLQPRYNRRDRNATPTDFLWACYARIVFQAVA